MQRIEKSRPLGRDLTALEYALIATLAGVLIVNTFMFVSPHLIAALNTLTAKL